MDNCAFLIQNDMCRKSLQMLRNEEPDSDLPALVEAALFSKEKQYAKAIQTLKVILTAREKNTLKTFKPSTAR